MGASSISATNLPISTVIPSAGREQFRGAVAGVAAKQPAVVPEPPPPTTTISRSQLEKDKRKREKDKQKKKMHSQRLAKLKMKFTEDSQKIDQMIRKMDMRGQASK